MLKLLKIFSVTFLAVFLNSNVHASEIHSLPTHKHVFDNGLTLLVTEMPTNDMVSVYGLVLAGSATEDEHLGAGLSHFLEHMTFKTTENREVGEVAADIQAVGGTVNATTSLDRTTYQITVPAEAFATAVDVLSDQLFHMTLDEDEFAKEREVIFNEMRMNNDNPDRRISRILFETHYRVHPYGIPVIGYEKLFADISSEELMAYYRKYYVPSNIVISVAGNIDTQKAIERVEEKFAHIPRGAPVIRNLPSEPVQMTSRQRIDYYNTELTRLALSFPSTSLLHPDLYALDVLAMVLGQGNTSRLYQKLYKELQLVRDISAWNYTPVDQGLFVVSADLEDENTEEVLKIILEEIERLKTSGVSGDELDRAKRAVLSQHVMSQQTTGAVAYSKATDFAYTGDSSFSDQYVNMINAVTAEEVEDAARRYLDLNRKNLVLLRPEMYTPVSTKESRVRQMADIQLVTLENGMKVLLRNDPTFPLISVRLALEGGTRLETENTNGLANMFARAWRRGSRKFTNNELDELVEDYGMNFTAYSGRNSVGLKMDLLAQDWETGLDVLSDVAINPRFDEAEIEKVRTDMLAKLKLLNDSIFQEAFKELQQRLFPEHPFGLRVEGQAETIKAFTKNDLKDYHAKVFAPENMVLAVYGDIETDSLLKKIEKSFGGLKPRSVDIPKQDTTPLQDSIRIAKVKDKQQAITVYGFHAGDMFDDDRYDLEVLAAILGSSFNGRMFTNIRDKHGKAYTLGGGYLPGYDAGMLYFYVVSAPEDVPDVIELLKTEFENIKTEGTSTKELDEIKMYLKGSFKGALQTNGDLAFTNALDELYGLGYLEYKNYDSSIDAVTVEDVKDIANKYLDLQRSVLVTVEPEQE